MEGHLRRWGALLRTGGWAGEVLRTRASGSDGRTTWGSKLGLLHKYPGKKKRSPAGSRGDPRRDILARSSHLGAKRCESCMGSLPLTSRHGVGVQPKHGDSPTHGDPRASPALA